MGIFDGQPVDAANSNPAWIDANADDATVGKLDLHNADSTNSGSFINNIQRELNSMAFFMGKPTNVAKDTLPVWATNNRGTSTDKIKARTEAIDLAFNGNYSTGHTHSGVDGQGPQINAATLSSVPLRAYRIEGSHFLGVTGSTLDVSSVLTGQDVATDETMEGVVVFNPRNLNYLRSSSGTNYKDAFTDSLGNEVFARLTNVGGSGGTWTLSFFTFVSAIETSYTFTSPVDIAWFYLKIFNPLVNPPVFNDFEEIPSDNITTEVAVATTTLKGKVQLASAAATEVGSSSSAGTANATVANADHAHKGVHSVGIFGDATDLFGDVELEASSTITLTRTGQRIKIESLGTAIAFQETPAGAVNGINDTFGPLTYAPTTEDSVLVFVDEIAVNKSAWSLVANSVVFDGTHIPQTNQTVYVYYLTTGTPGQFYTEYHTVTVGEAAAKQFNFLNTPADGSKVLVDVIGNSAQIYGVDFTVSGNIFDWNGYGLDGVLASGDVVRLFYFS